MSLKAKLEAVIYAAEEPVTLAQLAVLFATDALELKAQQAAIVAEAAEEDATLAAAQSLSLLNTGQEPDPDLPEPNSEAPAELSDDQLDPEPASREPEVAAEAAPAEESAPETDGAAEVDAEARRIARLREREARAIIRQLLDELIAAYAGDDRGIEIREIAGGYRVATKPEYHDSVRAFVKSLKPALRLSLPALETLAVIAYKQPVTAPEVNEIRGVDSSGVFGSLLARKLIATAGRKPVIGRPILYKTTREFLLRFGLKDVSELPSMEEFEKLAAIELEEPEFSNQGEAETEPAPDLNPNLEFDRNSDQSAEEPGSGERPQLAEMPAVTAVSPNPAQSAATPAENDSAVAAPAAPFPN